MKKFTTRKTTVNLYGRVRTARANRIVSRSATTGGLVGCDEEATGAPQTPHSLAPAPTIAPQERHIVGRLEVDLFGSLDNCLTLTSVMLNRKKHHAGVGINCAWREFYATEPKNNNAHSVGAPPMGALL